MVWVALLKSRVRFLVGANFRLDLKKPSSVPLQNTVLWYNYLWLCFASFSITYTSILAGRIFKIVCTNINIYVVNELNLFALFVCWTWHPHASWHQARIVVELPVTTFLVYLQANDSRKQLHDKEKEVLDLRQEVIGLKHSLKEANDQCILLFNEVQKAWRVSSSLQADLKVDI